MLNRIVVITTICISEERQRELEGGRGAGGTANGNQKAQSTKVCYAFCNLFMQTTTTSTTTKATQNAANYVI